MLYLAGQFAWFLLAAFLLGGAMGWIGQSGRDIRVWSPAWTWLAALSVVGAGLAWFQFVNGMLATWVETALLFVVVYWLGCVGGGLLGAAASRRRDHASVDEPLPAARVEPVLDVSPPVVPVEDENRHPGLRPAGLAAARAGKPDDLKLIKGIGPQNEQRLHGLGIWHFGQIAAWTPQNVEWAGSYLAFPGRIERENWVGQAATLATVGKAGDVGDVGSATAEIPPADGPPTEPVVGEPTSGAPSGGSEAKKD